LEEDEEKRDKMKAPRPRHGKTKGEFLLFCSKNSYDVKRLFDIHIVYQYDNSFGFHKKVNL